MDDLARPHARPCHCTAQRIQPAARPGAGRRTRRSEVQRALQNCASPDEIRPYALRRLRARIEANLSGLLGPAVAHSIIERCIPFQPGSAAKPRIFT